MFVCSSYYMLTALLYNINALFYRFYASLRSYYIAIFQGDSTMNRQIRFDAILEVYEISMLSFPSNHKRATNIYPYVKSFGKVN